ncbi:MAG: hypothetical protein HYZ63_03365 [Candidatus Andersenbacteria bacterium]|nr:hypothetical protein [Candidatus Andersenbacteria bacterium]
MIDVRALLREYYDDPLGLLQALGGYYYQPPGGKLVGYAGTYEDATGAQKQWVGRVYANFARADRYPLVPYTWAQDMRPLLIVKELGINVFLGAPEGGKSFADKLALVSEVPAFVFPDVEKVLVPGVAKPKKKFVFERHELEPDLRVAWTEDAANNFSTSDAMIDLILQAKCTPVAMFAILNRSPTVGKVYKSPRHGIEIPVFARLYKPMPEYKQDDPEVADDIANGRIEFVPRKPENWAALQQDMAAAA